MADKALMQQLRKDSPMITVGVLTADMMSLGTEIEQIEQSGVKLLHFDVMDGCFCPLMTMGPPFIKAIKTHLLKDVHLMVANPMDNLGSYVAAGADILTINVESCIHLHRALQMIGEMDNVNDSDRGIIRGVSLNPSTSVEVIRPVIDEIEMVLLLAVNPGWSGQKFITATQDKLSQLKKLISQSGRDILICIDGGIKKTNIGQITAMGVDIIVTGSAVFDGKTPGENARFMIEAVKQA